MVLTFRGKESILKLTKNYKKDDEFSEDPRFGKVAIPIKKKFFEQNQQVPDFKKVTREINRHFRHNKEIYI
jgi:hypothetical protein